MLTDLLTFLVMLIGVMVFGGLMALGIVLSISAHERQRARTAWLQFETLRAARRIHDTTSAAFQAMLDEVRDQQRGGGS